MTIGPLLDIQVSERARKFVRARAELEDLRRVPAHDVPGVTGDVNALA